MNNKELFIEGYLKRIAEMYPLSASEQENKNLAFEIFAIAALLDKPFQEVYDTIMIRNRQGTNSKKDGGFDGIWFQDAGEYYVMHVFQTKNSRTLKANELDKFRNDFRDIFIDGNRIGKQNIEDLQPKIDEYQQISEQGMLIETRLYFVFSGQKKDPNAANNQAIYDTYHHPDPLGAYFAVVDSDDLYEKISSLTQRKRSEIRYSFRPEQSNISFSDHQGLYTFSIVNIKAANFRAAALDLCKLMDEEARINGSIDSLFEENIRGYLGIKVRANKRMQATLNNPNDAIYFPFLNNGITIICEELTLPAGPQGGMYILPVRNPQIVNGLQTSRVLYDNYKRNPTVLDGVFVNIRVYETRESDLIAKITDATNTQSPINYRDKISNKDFNGWARQLFENEGINYITKRGQSFDRDARNYSEAVESETVIKYWYATFFEEPETAKNSISLVLQHVFDAATLDKHPLEELFGGEKDSAVYNQLLTAYKIYKYVQKGKNHSLEVGISVNDWIITVYADELIAYGIYKYIGKNLDAFKDEGKMAEAYTQVMEGIKDIVSSEEEKVKINGRPFSFNSYFKKSKCRYDLNEQMNWIESETLIHDLKVIR